MLWRRDTERAKELISEVDMTIPTHVGSLRWLRLTAGGEDVPVPHPPLPPGTERPRLLHWFWLQMEVEIACFKGEYARALEVLRQLDTEGSFDLQWLEGVPLFGPLRAMPEARAIRESFAARAARVVEAYLAPDE